MTENIKNPPDIADLQEFFYGTFRETFDATVSSDGATITLSLEKSGGGDLTMRFSDGFTTLDCTPAVTVALTAGGVTTPQTNWVYIPKSTKVLTVSTSDFPADQEHIKIGVFILLDATHTQSDGGALANQNFNDHSIDANNYGHLSHITEQIRLTNEGAHYHEGIDPTITITTNAGSADNVDLATSAGVLYQLHRHLYPAQDTAGSTTIHVVNDNATPYTEISDLNSLLTDANGVTMSNKYFNLIVWGACNKSGEHSPLFLNLPTGSYNNLSDALNDVDTYDVFSLPHDFVEESSTGFLISRFTFKHSSAQNGTWTLENTLDLRGRNPITASSSGTGLAQTEFSDNQFKLLDDGDATKIIQFQADQITTGNTRTITMADTNIDLKDIIIGQQYALLMG